MSAIVRLQGLPPAADSFDIRQFFYGLNIPRGGVYITGGKYGEAFIIFSTYEDANYAMSLTGRPLRNSCIYLSYSTEAEMRRALEVYRITPNEILGTPNRPKPSFIYIHGMPQKATKVDIREFFRGFKVDDVLFLKFVTGVRNGNAIVRFEDVNEASEALKLDGVFLCGCPVTLKLSSEEEWKKNGGDLNLTRERSPLRSTRYRRRSRTRSRSPPRRERRRSPYIREFYVHLINVSYRAEKKDIKKFFFDLDMDDSHITFLLDKEGKRTREAFVMFTTQKDYKRALNLNLDSFKGHTLNILPISKKAMILLIDRMKNRVTKDHPSSKKSPSRSPRESKKIVYLQNFASGVTKEEVINFFTNFSVKEDHVTLLLDDKGVSLGEALVKLSDEKEARKAEKLNHEKYQDKEILLSFVSEKQMKDLLKGPGKDADAQNPDQASGKHEGDLVSQADEPPDATGESSQSVEPVQETEKVPGSEQEPPLESAKEMEMDITPSLELEQKEGSSEASEPVQKHIPAAEFHDGGDLPEDDGGDLLEDDGGDLLEDDGGDLPEDDGGDLPEGMTRVFIRDLPDTVTEAEISDFFHDYNVSSVNLKDIGTGVATVHIADAEAKSAIEALNEKEVGLKRVLLSLD